MAKAVDSGGQLMGINRLYTSTHKIDPRRLFSPVFFAAMLSYAASSLLIPVLSCHEKEIAL